MQWPSGNHENTTDLIIILSFFVSYDGLAIAVGTTEGSVSIYTCDLQVLVASFLALIQTSDRKICVVLPA